MDADVHHGLGLLLILAMAHYLVGKLAGGNHLVHEAVEWRLGIHWTVSCAISVLCAFCVPAVTAFQARHSPIGLACGLGDVDALPRPVLDYRTQLFSDPEPDFGGHRCSRCHGWPVA